MTRTKITTLALFALSTLGVGWLMLKLMESRGTYLPPVTWPVPTGLLIISAGVLAGGLTVRAYQRGKRPGLSGIRAAQLTLFAKAASHTGSLLLGWYASQALNTVTRWQYEPQRDRFASALFAVGAALALTAAGIISERWGQLPPPSAEDHGSRPGNLTNPPNSASPGNAQEPHGASIRNDRTHEPRSR